MSLKKVVFYRDYRSFQGGHLKVWDYFNHCQQHPGYSAEVFFSAQSRFSADNPWCSEGWCAGKESDPELSRYDVFFIAGKDWPFFLNTSIAPDKVVVNLIQGFSHADPADEKFKYLSRKAVRICVSKELENALLETKQVNGPLFTIPNGVDWTGFSFPKQPDKQSEKILIVGYKQKVLACAVYDRLSDFCECEVELLLEESLPRADFLRKISESNIVVLLPLSAEGFFLPALEAMFFDTVVVCPDCVGNRSFCLDGVNCLFPDYSIDSIISSVKKARSLSLKQRAELIDNANKMSKLSFQQEKMLFRDILDNLDAIWYGK